MKECPFKYIFGKDFDTNIECNECHIWTLCGEEFWNRWNNHEVKNKE